HHLGRLWAWRASLNMHGFGLSSGLGCAVGGGHYTPSALFSLTLNELAARGIPPRNRLGPGAVIQGESWREGRAAADRWCRLVKPPGLVSHPASGPTLSTWSC